jgi:hypothetical protein
MTQCELWNQYPTRRCFRKFLEINDLTASSSAFQPDASKNTASGSKHQPDAVKYLKIKYL